LSVPYSKEVDVGLEDLLNYDSSNNEIKINKVVINRLTRDSLIARALKKMYNNTCQLCNEQLKSSSAGYFSEAHHIRPFNQHHQGQDSISNMIVLCPNHHVQFDQLYYCIHPETWMVHCIDKIDKYHNKPLHRVRLHDFSTESLEYMWKLFLSKEVENSS